MVARFTLIFCALNFLLAGLARADDQLAAATVVIFNAEMRDSAALAKFYAQKRGIARDHLVGLHCPVEEEISRKQYDATIAEPLRSIFSKRHWWKRRDETDPARGFFVNSIRFVALIKGIPLKIRSEALYPGDKIGTGPTGRNEASVDSELATLASLSREITGPAANPYFQSYRPITEFTDSALLLVCRLDAPTGEAVRRMITDSIATEKTGLWGRAYIDEARNNTPGFEVGDKWLEEIHAQLHKVGIPLVYNDEVETFPDGFPMTNCALYYGWYAGNVTGPFRQPDFRFVPGAIAVHIHSFSAVTLRDPKVGWVGPFLLKGAAASLGNVYEPYLQLTPNLNIFNDRLLHGFTFAESAYMSQRAVSWMSVMVGDPLYRPYGTWLQLDSKRDDAKTASSWKMYHDFALKNSDKPAEEYRKLARQTALRSDNCPMLEDVGLMEARDGNWPDAISCFQQVRACYTKRDDILRAVLEEATGWSKQQNPQRGLAVIRSVLRLVSDAPAVELLRQMAHDLKPPEPALTPTPSPP